MNEPYFQYMIMNTKNIIGLDYPCIIPQSRL